MSFIPKLQTALGVVFTLTTAAAISVTAQTPDVNYDKDNFVYDMNQRGPIMGLGFKF
jgi:hypothetical protein